MSDNNLSNNTVIPPKPNFKGLKKDTEEFKAKSREIRTWRMLYEPGFKEKTTRYTAKYCKENSLKIKEINNSPDNKIRRNLLQKQKRLQCYEEYRNYHKKYFNNRYYNDPIFRLNCIIRSSVRDCIKEGFIKNIPSLKNIGCSVATLKTHIELQFSGEMSWNNYGEWHIDHIIPLALGATFNLPLNVIWHYSNLQPLKASLNMSKHHSINKKYLTKLLAHPNTPDELVDIALALSNY